MPEPQIETLPLLTMCQRVSPFPASVMSAPPMLCFPVVHAPAKSVISTIGSEVVITAIVAYGVLIFASNDRKRFAAQGKKFNLAVNS
jgi:hypothetical protein